MMDPTAPGRSWDDSTRGGGDGTSSTLSGDTFSDALSLPAGGQSVDTSYHIDMQRADEARKVAEQATAAAAEIMDRTGADWGREDEATSYAGRGSGVTDYEQRLAQWQAAQLEARNRAHREADQQRAAAEQLAAGLQPRQPVRVRIRQPAGQRQPTVGQLQPPIGRRGQPGGTRRQLPRPPGSSSAPRRRRNNKMARQNAIRLFWIGLVFLIVFGAFLQGIIDSMS